MKKLFTLLIFIAVIVMNTANAQSVLPSAGQKLIPVKVLEIQSEGNLMPVIGPTPRSVYTELELEVAYCRGVDESMFDLKIVQDGMRSYQITILEKKGMVDCFGPARRQIVRLNTTKLGAHPTIVIKNPVLIKTQYVY